MISIITATFGANRVEKVELLHHQIKDTATIPIQHIIVVDGNKETYQLLKEKNVGDTLLCLPGNIEWTRATNIGERFAQYPYVCSMDDDTNIRTPDMFKRALEIFNEKFPNGAGILGFSNGENNCPEWITTRKYAYAENLNHFIWPEYWHEGDYETYLKASRKGQYTWSRELEVADIKFKDISRSKSLQCVEFDQPLLKHRENLGFPNHFSDISHIPSNDRIRYLEKNYYNE